MSDIKRLLEAIDKVQYAGEKVGQKPGDQWRGDDKKTPGKKLVGEENVIKELDSHLKENAVERRLKEKLVEFKQNISESIDVILARYPKEVEHFKQGGDLDYDLEGALWDYYFNRGDIRNYDADASEWIAQQLADELGIEEGTIYSKDEIIKMLSGRKTQAQVDAERNQASQPDTTTAPDKDQAK